MEPLAVAIELFSEMDRAGIRYAHWKSNEHLLEALSGKTDLDLLVDPLDRELFEAVVASFGFVRMKLPRARYFPGRRGFLGFDRETGRLIQLDVHHALILGEQLVKNHRLPIEDSLLANTIKLCEVRVPISALETVVFYIRVCLKTTLRQCLTSAIKGSSAVPRNIEREASWLANRVTAEQLADALASLDLPLSVDEIEEFHRRVSSGRLDWRYLQRAKRSLLRRLRPYQRRSTLVAWLLKGALRVRSSRIGRRVGLGIPPKTLDKDAPVVAVVGADGSGKSRLTSDLAEWLGWKLAVRHLYFGQPKNSLVFKLLNKPGSLARRSTTRGEAKGALSRGASVGDSVKWLYLANRRRRMSARARREARQGKVVIAERFPLREFWQMEVPMDGPRLTSNASWLAGLERRLYEAVASPDLVLVLAADLDTLRRRKTDIPLSEHLAKAEAVAAIQSTSRVHVIDAGQPYEVVLRQAKQRVWEEIVATR